MTTTDSVLDELAAIRTELAELRRAQTAQRAATVTAFDVEASTFDVEFPDGAQLAGIPAPPHFLPAAGDLVLLRLSGATPVYEPARIAENAVGPGELAEDAVDGKTITGVVLQTAGAGPRVWIYQLDGEGVVEMYSGDDDVDPAKLSTAVVDGVKRVVLDYGTNPATGVVGPSMGLLASGAFIDADAIDLLGNVYVGGTLNLAAYPATSSAAATKGYVDDVPALRLVRQTAQAVPNNTWTTVTWTREVFDSHDMWVSGSVVTCKQEGYYQLTAGWAAGGAAGGRRGVRVLVNGQLINLGRMTATPTASDIGADIQGLVFLNVDAAVQLSVYQDSGAQVSTSTLDYGLPTLSLHFVRPK